MDHSPEAIDEELLKRTAAKPKPEMGALTDSAESPPKELTDLQVQILSSFRGEDVSGRPSDKW